MFIHSAIDLQTFPFRTLTSLVRHHDIHHDSMKAGYYASITPLWDVIFRTTGEPLSHKPKADALSRASQPRLLVTGSGAGIGRERRRKWRCVVVPSVIGRDRFVPEAAATYVSEHAKSGAATASLRFFVAFPVRKAADEIQRRCRASCASINNAGLWHPQRTLSRDGIETRSRSITWRRFC